MTTTEAKNIHQLYQKIIDLEKNISQAEKLLASMKEIERGVIRDNNYLFEININSDVLRPLAIDSVAADKQALADVIKELDLIKLEDGKA